MYNTHAHTIHTIYTYGMYCKYVLYVKYNMCCNYGIRNKKIVFGDFFSLGVARRAHVSA